MAAKKTPAANALATTSDFKLVSYKENLDPELLEELQDEMGDLDPDSGILCRKIKIPAGGGLFYNVESEDGDEEPMKEIKGVVLFTHRLNGYWQGAFGDDASTKAPSCSSTDGKTALDANSGEVRQCDTCPLNQYGTGTDAKGNPTKGKACKNMRRIYLMMDGDPNVYLLTVPPTSIKDVNAKMQRILAQGTPYTGMTVSLTLEKARSAGGTDYSKVKIDKDALLAPAVAAKARALRQQIKEQYKTVALTLGDYVAPAADTQGAQQPRQQSGAFRPAGRAVDVSADDFDGGFEQAPPIGDEDLPFA